MCKKFCELVRKKRQVVELLYPFLKDITETHINRTNIPVHTRDSEIININFETQFGSNHNFVLFQRIN